MGFMVNNVIFLKSASNEIIRSLPVLIKIHDLPSGIEMMIIQCWLDRRPAAPSRKRRYGNSLNSYSSAAQLESYLCTIRLFNHHTTCSHSQWLASEFCAYEHRPTKYGLERTGLNDEPLRLPSPFLERYRS